MKYCLNAAITFLGLFTCLISVPAQQANEKKNIIGTWLSDKKEEQKIVFNADGTCVEYFSVGNPIKQEIPVFVPINTPKEA